MYLKIKASGINNLSDARYFSTFAEWVGFCFDPASPRFVEVQKAKEIAQWLAGVRLVGEFGAQNEASINTIVRLLLLDTIETDLDLAYAQLDKFVSTIIRRIPISQHMSDADVAYIAHRNSYAAYILLDFMQHQLSWDNIIVGKAALTLPFIQQLCEERAVIIRPYNPTSADVIHMRQVVPLKVLDLVGGDEQTTGVRTFEDIEPLISDLFDDDTPS